ncbi:MAG TPA: bifunctional folylpolyglutamate synthase/dihydrofolate synthase, partial [Thiotrichaceae bacterium]|nr:bifunctional folylpolyglutamate synthase/dihydrofolate synthase [Thiotrichaceae bacterium]
YNERIRINHVDAEDSQICEAFAAIDDARHDISLSYFEFATLAAVWLFRHEAVDVGILEVGMGGRLDAVNCWDADVGVITSIGIDHVEWLGDNRDSIATEKAGIFRSGQIAVSGDPKPPKSIEQKANELGTVFIQAGRDFQWQLAEKYWQCQWGEKQFINLPYPRLFGEHQVNNAATAIVATQSLSVQIEHDMIVDALETVNLSARMELLQVEPSIILDVAHNPHAVKKLAEWLQENPIQGKTYTLFSMLEDKDISQVVAMMAPYVDQWHVFGLEELRGLREEALVSRMNEQVGSQVLDVKAYTSINKAWRSCEKQLKKEDRVIVFGSFLVISQFKVIF